jgi:hypothetical protein
MISSAEMERMMKVQEVILKAMAGSLKWWEIIGVSDRTMRRGGNATNSTATTGCNDRTKRRPSPKRVPLKTAEKVVQLFGRSTSISTCAIFTRS